MMKRIIAEIKSAENLLIVSHQRPDGDSIGSQIGLYWALKSMGKNVSILNEDPVPEMFRFLEGWRYVKNSLPQRKPIGLILVVDASGVYRAGERISSFVMKKASDGICIINIDHHESNDCFGNLNYVLTDASSTSEILFKMMQRMKANIPPQSAESFLTGLVTDTGMFKFDTVGRETMKTASEMIKRGASLSRIAQHVYMEKPFAKIRLMGEMFMRAHIERDRIISYLTKEDFIRYKAKQEYTDGLVNELLYIEGMNAAVLLTEESSRRIRVSFRSKGKKYDMNEFASVYGGGGHFNAAGAVFTESLADSLKILTRDLEKI